MKGRIRFLVTIALLCIVGVMVFYKTSNSDNNGDSDNGNDKDDTVVAEVDKLLAKDLEKSYPNTAREVVTLFTRIQKCYYNDKLSSDQLVSLAYMAMELFDEEMVNANPFDEYYKELTDDIKHYKDEGKTITRVIVDKSSDVIYSTVDDIKYARLNCIYYLKTNDKTEKTTETYALRKDENGRWKILGWQLLEENEESE